MVFETSNSMDQTPLGGIRCTVCMKRVKMLEFRCKCDGDKVFCITHRYPENHNCTYNYKACNKSKIEMDNPRIICTKVARF